MDRKDPDQGSSGLCTGDESLWSSSGNDDSDCDKNYDINEECHNRERDLSSSEEEALVSLEKKQKKTMGTVYESNKDDSGMYTTSVLCCLLIVFKSLLYSK